jgi:hypothetical protein
VTRPDACVSNEQAITGALMCAVCWRYKLGRHRCDQFKEHGFRLVAKGKKPFGVRYEVGK